MEGPAALSTGYVGIVTVIDKEHVIGRTDHVEIQVLRNLVLIYSKLKDKARIKRLSHYVELLRTREKAR